MATGSVISICNRALLAIGSQAQLSSLNEGSTQASACATLFTPTFESLARAAYWNCLRKQAVLSLIGAAQGTPENPTGNSLPLPPSPWLYSYQLPSDSLQARFIVPSFPTQATGNPPISPAMIAAQTCMPLQQILFRVAYATDINGNPIQIILTNQSQAQLVYTVNQPNPQIWDSLFQSGMVASLGAFLVPALSLNMSLAQMQISLAEKAVATARVRDGDEGTTSQDHIPDWIQARSIGGTITGYGYGCYGWSDMNWGIF